MAIMSTFKFKINVFNEVRVFDVRWLIFLFFMIINRFLCFRLWGILTAEGVHYPSCPSPGFFFFPLTLCRNKLPSLSINLWNNQDFSFSLRTTHLHLYGCKPWGLNQGNVPYFNKISWNKVKSIKALTAFELKMPLCPDNSLLLSSKWSI